MAKAPRTTTAKKKAKKPAAAPKRTTPAQPKRAKLQKAPALLVPLQQTVDDYIAKVAPWQRAIIQKLRAVIRMAAPRASESIKWGQPVYEHKGPFSYIKAHAAQINFGFWRGTELDDPKRVLQGEGNRMRHVRLVETQPLGETLLAAFVAQAFKLNDKKGDPTQG